MDKNENLKTEKYVIEIENIYAREKTLRDVIEEFLQNK